jgi:hypothetical protein
LLSVTLSYNQNDYDNFSSTEYKNFNKSNELWRYSRRDVGTTGDNYSPNLSFSYTWKGKPGETVKVITGLNYSASNSDRDFYQQYLTPMVHQTEQTVHNNSYTIQK